MARAGTQRWRNPAPEGDDVQRSIELLDKVLSEYDEHDVEGEGEGGGGGGGSGGGGGGGGGGGDGGGCVGSGSGGGVGDCGSSTEPSIGLTPDDESPSLGHQSEDDGYMSMNGRKAKMALVALRPVPDCPEPQDPAGVSTQEFPPPPEEAERIISTLLPMVSPGNSSKRNIVGQASERRNNVSSRQQWMVAVEDSMRHGNAVTTQTTLPKTRHQRPYGWENGTVESLRLAQPPSPPSKFASLPYDGKVSFNWIPPRTNPSAVEKHREVRRRSSEECLEDGDGGCQRQGSPDRRDSHHLRKQQRQQNEIMKSSSVEDRLLMNRSDKESMRRNRNDSDSSEGRFSRNSESESRSSMPRSSSVSVERFSMRANCDSSDFSRANSTSNERFHSDFSIAVASASSNDHVSVPTSEPFSIRNLDFVSFALPRADSSERFSAPTSDRCSEERYSDLFSTRNSDFSTRNSADFRTQSEEERFSDDSLEELLPPPPPISKRHSIAWEVSLEDDPLYAPGSTKVVGRRRRKSSDVSSVGSASKLRDFDDWQDQRLSTTDDDLISPYSDSSTNDLDQIRPQELTKNGTYVIRRGRKKERKILPKTPTKTKSLSFENGEEGSRLSDVKRYSSTFDNIKSLLKEGKLEGLDEPPAEFTIPVPPPDLIRVVSMPAINNDASNRAHLEITVEEEEASDISDKDKERNNIELPRLPPSPIEDDQMDLCLDRSRDCNGIPTAPNLVDLDIGISSGNSALAETTTKKKLASAVSDDRLTSKIPVNLLIEDQIVKKALKENRRQLEKVSDAIKEIENVKNSESYCESKRWRNGDLKQSSKRNSFENEFPPVHDGRKPMIIDGSPYDGKTRGRQQQQQYSSDSETSKASSDADFADRRKLNGASDIVYSSSRRLRQNGIENHKNDQKQIENVIDAILEDSKNPEFQVSVDVMEFPPLPPSPVEEADEESCSDVGQSAVMTPPRSKSHSSSRTVEYRPRVPPHRVPPVIDPKEQVSLNTRSMDAGFAKGRRTPTTNNSRREDQRPRLETPSVYKIPCGKVYIGETGRKISIRIKEHQRCAKYSHFSQSTLAQHWMETEHSVQYDTAEGHNASTFKISKPRYVVSTILIVILTVTWLTIIYHCDISTLIKYDSVPGVLQFNCYFVLGGFIMIVTYILSKPRMRLLQTMLEISTRLPPESYQKMSRLIHAKDIFGFFFLLGQVWKCYSTTYGDFFLKVMGTYLTLMVFQMDMLYMNCVCVLKACFKRINDNLVNLRELMVSDEPHLLRRVYHEQRNPFLLLELKSLKKRHLMVSDTVQMLNAIFSLQLLATIVMTFAEITFSLYFYIVQWKGGVANVDLQKQIWYTYYMTSVTYYSIKIALMVWACDTGKDQALQIGTTVHDVLINTNDKQIKDELQLFSLQILHRENTFCAKGLTVDATLLTAVPVERRTLPTDLPGPSRRRPFTKRHSPSAEGCSSGGSSGGGGTSGSIVTGTGSGMQTSCSLPETPVFARGSDIPRTPQHAGNSTQSRRQPGWYAPTTTTGYRRNNPGLEQAIIGTELLRLAGGPNRGWYPTRKANQPRPASIEHLERLNNVYDARLPSTGDQRKPLTLPTNITPNKYFGQSKHSSASSTREALRRVTSLLIKKGSSSKDGKGSKDNNSSSGPYAGCADGSDVPKKKGFFKGFWKRSRHYSLENQ